MRFSVAEGQRRQRIFAQPEAGVIGIAIMYGKVVRSVVTAANARKTADALFIDRKLRGIPAIIADVAGNVVGNGMAAARIPPCAVALREDVAQPSVVGVRPLVSRLYRGYAVAIAVEQLSAVLRLVDQARPVGASGKVCAALVVGILEGQNAQLIIRRRFLSENGGRQQRADHQDSQHKREQSFSNLCLHSISSPFYKFVYFKPPKRHKQREATTMS